MENKELKVVYRRKPSLIREYDLKVAHVYTCNECKRNVPEEEFDKSLGHCIECHGG